MAIPPGIIDDIRDRADILSVVGQYVSLKKAGRNWVGLCPFHSEKTPSFSVSPEKNMFYCFGCGAGGNVFSFLTRIEGLTFVEAVERMAQRVGVEIPKRPLTQEEQNRKEDKERLAAIVEEAAIFFHRVLTKEQAGEEGREYLKKRAIDIELARSFRIGWAQREWDSLLNYLRSKGFAPRDIEKAGLVVEKAEGGYYDRFRARIMFPIMSVQGRVLGFGGRVVVADEEPKYMNSPESPLYQKSRVLYGLHAAHKPIREKDAAIVVEGYFDVLAMVKHGFDNTVAPCGTALTVEQVDVLKRYTKNLYPFFDADEAGEKARARSLDVILRAGAFAKSAVLPVGKDPDEFLQLEGAETLGKILDNAPPLLDSIADKILNENGASVEGRRKSLTAIAEFLAVMSDKQLRDMYIMKFAPNFAGPSGGGEDLIRREIASAIKASPNAPVRAASNGARQVKAGEFKDMPEYYLAAMLLAHPELKGEAIKDKDVLDDISEPELKNLASKFIEEDAPVNASKYLDALSPEKASILSKLIMEEPEFGEKDRLGAIWAETSQRVKLLGIKRRKEELQALIARAKPDEIPELIRQKNSIMDMERRLRAHGA